MITKFGKFLKLIKKISDENNNLKNGIKSFNIRMKELENNARINNVEIHGIPNKRNKNLHLSMKKGCDNIDCLIDGFDIKYIF